MMPIPTHYNGTQFRSRLEAKWAVFFDLISLNWEYEPMSVRLESGVIYSPDFYLPGLHLNDLPTHKIGAYIEIKPSDITEEYSKKLKQFVKKTKSPLFLLTGKPRQNFIESPNQFQKYWKDENLNIHHGYNFNFDRCATCHLVKLDIIRPKRICTCCGNPMERMGVNTGFITNTIDKVTNYRFDLKKQYWE